MSVVLEKEIEHRLTSLEEKHYQQSKRFGERLDAHDRSLENINEKIEDIIKLLSTRPTWLVTGLVSILMTVTASLIVFVVTTHH